MQNILRENLLNENYLVTTPNNLYERLTVLKPHQFDNQSCCLLYRHGQCTRKTMPHDMIISLQFRKKRCFLSYNQGYKKFGKS